MFDPRKTYQVYSTNDASSERGIRDWTPRHRENTERHIQLATRYSRFVDFMKLFLPLAAAGLIIVAIFSSFIQGPDEQRIPFVLRGSIEDDLQMQNPEMTGYDAQGRPFNVTAAKGIQYPDDPNIMDFETIVGELNVPENGAAATNDPLGEDKIDITADKGRLKSIENVLTLKGNVTLTSEAGYEFRTERARVFFKDSEVSGNTTIYGTRDMGTVVADGFRVKENGNNIFFLGNVKTNIVPKKKSTETENTTDTTPE